MKHFIYTFSEHKARSDCAYTKTVRLYAIKKGELEFVGDLSDTFVSEFQLVMMCAEKYKALPKKYFVRSDTHGGYVYCNAWKMKQDKIANFQKVF